MDGFNLAYAVLLESFEDAVSLLIPEWQARGLYKTAYAPGTLREALGRIPAAQCPAPSRSGPHVAISLFAGRFRSSLLLSLASGNAFPPGGFATGLVRPIGKLPRLGGVP